MLDSATREPLLSTVEAATCLALSPRTLEAYRRKGGGPVFVALSRNVVRYRRSDLDAWVTSRSAPHTARARALVA
ncbi:helix-turn-helix transcriptional regulator [Brevundimonas sp.]|uniref:helix-turn-helix transcriptional regulator n=1 Tax=Brevundimonas sp. TaxID=1871086 RepID=UPI0039C88120